MRQLALVAHKLNPVIDDLRAVFGLEIGHRDPGVKVFGLENALLPVGSQFIEVVAPIQENTAGGRYLDRRHGDGGYMCILQCDDHGAYKRRVAELGIRKALDRDSAEFCNMQLHPRDTGGTFLEIDYQKGGEAPDGPWMPAGRNWKPAVRTDIVRAIAAAEIQSSKPDALAQRWAQILLRPLIRDGRGNPAIALEIGTIRFVPEADGRGEGLGGIDLVVADRARLLAAAEKRGRPIVNDTVMIGGIRFGLVAG
jgi:hypothetical protein